MTEHTYNSHLSD